MGERFDTSRPIYAQIVERLKAKILAGVYPPGGHLDSVRDLAAAAGVNPNTMQRHRGHRFIGKAAGRDGPGCDR